MENIKDYAKELVELKAKHGTVYELKVPLNDDETEFATVFLRKLDRDTYKMASKLIQKDELQGVEFLIKTLRIGGDSAAKINEDFDALRSAASSILPMLIAKEGSLKKN